MAKSIARLYKSFKPTSYKLALSAGEVDSYAEGLITITGQKIGPPSQRITFHQKGLKIIAAKIVRNDKKGSREYEVVRINHLPTFEEVRLHTAELLYPGDYEVVLDYKIDQQKAAQLEGLKDKKPNRELLPSIDESDAWSNVEFRLI